MKAKCRTQKEDRVIYVFVSPMDKTCFVFHCRKKSVRETYRHHTRQRRYCTERFMQDVEPHRPCMFVLEELPDVTAVRAYRYTLVWIRILSQHGYTCYNCETQIDHASDLLWSTQKLYDAHKDVCLDEMMTCDCCQVRTYKKTLCPFLNTK